MKTAAATLKAGEILKNAIRINELTPQKETASGTYVLLGAAKNAQNEPYVVEFVVNSYDNTVESVDVLYSANAKKESAARQAPQAHGKPLPATDSTISIAQLLDLARDYFPDVLPESVLRHFGFDRRPDGKLGESALFSEKGSERDLEKGRLMAQNERLQDRVDYWKGQTKRTSVPTIRKSDIDRLARGIIKDYDSTADAAAISAALTEAGNYLLRGEGEEGTVTWEGLRERVLPAAREIVKRAEVLTGGEAEEDVREMAKSIEISKKSLDEYDGAEARARITAAVEEELNRV